VASRFFGRFEHSVDIKGRIVLPARFRKEFDAQAFLSRYFDGCVALWTPEEFDKQLAAMEERQARSAEDRNLARIWAGTSAEVEIDRQGRMAVPTALRSYAQLGSSVLVMGALERVELWDPEAWEARVRPAEAAMINPSDRAAAVSAGS
jgi:MraZ protein